MADEIALAALIAMEEWCVLGQIFTFQVDSMCRGVSGSPKIDFRGGRVDAKEANVAGIPQPQDTLESHISSFSRQGFKQDETISLVACGHTFGGVQHVSFPDIVPPSDDPSNTPGHVPFDTTGAQFDTKM